MQPESVEDWLRLASQHEISAKTLAEVRDAAAQGHWHAGLAVECALKAYIMRKEKLNNWPSRDMRPDLYTHNLRDLMKIAGVTIPHADPAAPSWHVTLQWDRDQGYDPKKMPRRVARSMVEAAFGPNGVVTWIRSSLTR